MSAIDTLELLLDGESNDFKVVKDDNDLKVLPSNLSQTGKSITTKEPSVSRTETRTDYKEVPTYEDWSDMQGNEPWEVYAKKLGISKPNEPVLDENRQKRLAKFALLNDIGQPSI